MISALDHCSRMFQFWHVKMDQLAALSNPQKGYQKCITIIIIGGILFTEPQ